jgi:hypothetical protein
MRATTILAIIFGPLIVGALLPLVFGKALRGAVSEDLVCQTIGHATKRGFIDPAAKKKLYDDALKAPGLDPKTRDVFEGARKDC